MINKNILFRRSWWIFIAIVVIARLYLTGDRDILATNSPHDEYWYIHAALNKIWGGSYNQMAFMHLPIYSGWLSFLHVIGIPARLAIDLSWLLAVGYLALALVRLTRMACLAFFVFIFLAFHPYAMFIFDRALAETFLTVVSAAVLAAGIELWNCRDGKATLRSRAALVIYVVGFAIAYHTRKEGIVLAVPLLLLTCCTVFDRPRWWRGVNRPALAVPLLLAPFASTLLLGVMLSGANYLTWGVWARYELAAPGYERAVAALNSIDIGRTPRQITVTKEMMALAYQASPTFSELKPAMEGVTGQQWVAIASAFTSLPGEIGNGWFYWALRDVAAHTGWHASAAVADSKYAAVADELEQAFAAGRLKKRFMLSSFLDPDLAKWVPVLPSSAFNILQLVLWPQPGNMALPTENASRTQFDDYLVLTGRRAPPLRVELNGWMIVPVDSLTGLGTATSTFSWQRLGDSPRPDVQGAYAFSLSSTSAPQPTALHLHLPDGRQDQVALTSLKPGAVAKFEGTSDVMLGVDRLDSNFKPRRADRWVTGLSTAYEWMGLLICLATIGGVLAMLVQRKVSGLALMLAVVMSAVAARTGLCAILYASAWSGMQARYLLPIMPFFACMGALGVALMADAFPKKIVGKSN
jgi:hypothetical protein